MSTGNIAASSPNSQFTKPGRSCRSCQKICPLGHSLHDCLQKQRAQYQQQVDKRQNIEDFVRRNNLIKRTATDPCKSCLTLFGQKHTRGQCAQLRRADSEKVKTIQLLTTIRRQLGRRLISELPKEPICGRVVRPTGPKQKRKSKFLPISTRYTTGKRILSPHQFERINAKHHE